MALCLLKAPMILDNCHFLKKGVLAQISTYRRYPRELNIRVKLTLLWLIILELHISRIERFVN